MRCFSLFAAERLGCRSLVGSSAVFRAFLCLSIYLSRVSQAQPPMNAAAHLVGDNLSKTPGWHSHKWSGIALAPNGKLYSSPFTASKVLRIDPATDTTELIGDVLEPSGNIRWSGIALASDGKLYCSPNNASRVLRIDPATDATELISTSLEDRGGMWSGIAAGADGTLYCSPMGAARVLRIPLGLAVCTPCMRQLDLMRFDSV